jgi:hypothetical protein
MKGQTNTARPQSPGGVFAFTMALHSGFLMACAHQNSGLCPGLRIRKRQRMLSSFLLKGSEEKVVPYGRNKKKSRTLCGTFPFFLNPI